MTPSLRKQVEVEFQKGFAAFFPQLFIQNQTEFAKDYIEVYEKDIDRLLGEKQGQPQMPQMMSQPNQLTNQPSLPVQNVAPQVKMASI